MTEAALNTPYKNTIDLKDQPQYPGDIDLETRLANIIRWNAVAMVLRRSTAAPAWAATSPRICPRPP